MNDPRLYSRVNDFVVFNKKDNQFYKIAFIDYRNYVFDLWGEKKSVRLSFEDGIMLDWTDNLELGRYYQLYLKEGKDSVKKGIIELITWIQTDRNELPWKK